MILCKLVAIAAVWACHAHAPAHAAAAHHHPAPRPHHAAPAHHRHARPAAAPAERIEITEVPGGLEQACAEAEAEGAELYNECAERKALREGRDPSEASEGPPIEWAENPVTGEQIAELEAEVPAE